jgi:DNA recombination protein RmuC
MTGTVALIVGIAVGLVLGGLIVTLWWRVRFVELRSAQGATQRAAIGEITEAAEDLERRQLALTTTVSELVRPVREQLEQYRLNIESFQSANSRLHGELKNQLEQLASSNAGLQRETGNLVSALRRPEVRGSWGEQQLRRIVELAGMVEHCDFDEQVQMTGPTGDRLRPDVVVHLPNAREVIVDAKVPLDAYIDGLAAEDNAARDASMQRHATQLNNHVEGLAKKAYQQGYAGSVDFVVAFVPGDPLLAAAYEHDPGIFERAIANHVIIATPTTLIALLKAVAYGWQQEAVARNAQEIADAGRELYGRLRTLSTHIVDLGGRLRSTVEAYNRFLGSLERRVLPQARRFEELHAVAQAEQHLAEPTVLTELPQQPVVPELATAVDGDVPST